MKKTGRAAPWTHEPTLPRNIKTQSVASAAANKPKNETLSVLDCWTVLDVTFCSISESGASSTSAIEFEFPLLVQVDDRLSKKK